jgi:predicted Zn-dependent protease with MMP-like domain
MIMDLNEPDPEAFRAMAEAAYERIPAVFTQHTGDLLIQTPDFAEGDVLVELGITDPYELLGLYQGVDLTRKSLFDPLPENDRVFLYRQPILRFWRSGTDSLEHIVEHVLVHEIGHHFGLSDDDMHAIEEDG